MSGRPAQAVRRGRRLGEFVLDAPIGRGGFADVYHASQPSLGRAAVIKILRGAVEPRRVQQFEREARMACQLDHPFASHVYAFGVEPDGVMWIAMELVRGISLAEWIETKGPLPLGRFVSLFERLCEVVHTAHAGGLIHRDIKPSNVMVVTRAGKLMPKLLDFGIAIARDPLDDNTPAQPPATTALVDDALGVLDDSTDPAHTSDQQRVAGTPAYMAPEQWSGGRHDHRVDIYALGVLAYRALTGRAPLTGATVRELRLAHLRQPIPPLGGEFPPALDAVLARALAKDPADRFATALELATAFAAAAAGSEGWIARDDVRGWLASAPPQLAGCVASIAAARDLTEACDATQRLVDAIARWIGIVALASAAELGVYVGDIAQLARLRHEPLAARDWLDLASALCQPFVERDEDFPIPELVPWCAARDGDRGPEALLALAAVTRGEPTTFPRDLLARVLRAVSFLYGYTVLADGHEWTAATRDVAAGAAIAISDGDHNALVALSPLVAAAAPAPGEPVELFMTTGGGRSGARQLAEPYGYEREVDDVWRWLDARFAIATPDRGATLTDRTPYRGLAPFTTHDADLFFGRERLVDQLFNRILIHPFVALTGPSGSGKSSLVFAGLIPRLPEGWFAIAMRPGRSPLVALDAALHDAGVPGLAESLPVLLGWLRSARRRLLLVIDQAEELLTLAAPDQRRALAAILAELVAAGDRVRVVVTLRHDFIGRADELPEWRELIQHNLLLVTVPSRDELVHMMIGPARHVGYEFDDPALVADMVNEVADRPGALPLLSFAAARLWDARDPDRQQLTRAAYTAMGGVAGALAGYAEETFAALTPHQQAIARELLRQLITADGTSAPARRAELATIRDGAAAVLDHLITARLVVVSERDDGGEDVALVHEALIDRWPRLVQWRADDAAGARHRDELRAAAARWDERARAASYLWRGEALATLRDWVPRWAGSLTASERAFSDASMRAARRARWSRRLVIGTALVALSSALAITLALYRRSEHNRDESEQRFTEMLVDRGRVELLAERPLRALVYFSAAYSRGVDGAGMRLSLALAARAMDRELARTRAHPGEAALATTLTTAVLTVAPTGGEVRARSWQVADGKITPIATFERPDHGILTAFDMSPNGEVVASSGPERSLVVWDRSGKVVATAPAMPVGISNATPIAVGNRVIATGWERDVALFDITGTARGVLAHPAHTVTDNRQLTLSSDGERLLWTAGTAVELWRTTDRTLVWRKEFGELVAASFHGDGVIAGTAGGLLFAFDVQGEQIFKVQAHQRISAITNSEDGSLIVTAGSESFVRLWSGRDGRAVGALEHAARVDVALLSSNGQLLLTYALGSQATLWDAVRRIRLAKLDLGTELSTIRFAVDQRTLIATDRRGGLRVLDTQPDTLATTFDDHHAPVFSAAVAPSPDGPEADLITTFAADHTLRRWRLSTGQQVAAIPFAPPQNAPPFLQRIARLADGRIAAPYQSHAGLWDVAIGQLTGLLQTNWHPRTIAADRHNHVAVINAFGSPAFGAPPSILVWDATTQQPIAHRTTKQLVLDLAFDPTSERVVYADADEVVLWDVASDRELWRVAVPNSLSGTTSYCDVDFASDGRLIAVTGRDGYVRLLRAADGALVSAIKQLAIPSALALSPDSALLAVASEYAIYMWDVATGQLAGVIGRHDNTINNLVFTPDGSRLVSSGWDGRALVWTIPHERRSPEELARAVADRVPLRLDGAELVTTEIDHIP